MTRSPLTRTFRNVLLLSACGALASCAAGAKNQPPTPAEITAAGNCGRAYSVCGEECRATQGLFDFSCNRVIDTFRTSWFESCEKSCRAGMDACATSPAGAVAVGFEKACRHTCPVFIWDERLGTYLTSTEAPTRCGEACLAGAETLE